MIVDKPYTSQLGAGLGLVSETKTLIELWSPGMTANQLNQIALESGRFPTMSARRLRNIIIECFAPRYLKTQGIPAKHLKKLSKGLSTADLTQLMMLFTCRANPILADFIRNVYWPFYASGRSQISNENGRNFVERSIDDGKIVTKWSETTIRRVSAYLTGCCADYGLLEKGSRSSRKIIPFRIANPVVAYLAYDLHFSNVGDNAILLHEDWQLFGLAKEDVLEELKRLSLQGLIILQSAGNAVRITWKLSNMEILCDVLTQS